MRNDLALHLQAMGNRRYRVGFRVTMHRDQLELPPRWRQPKRVFVNSMSDLFHEAVPGDFILAVFDVIARVKWHTFQVLTKRGDRLARLATRAEEEQPDMRKDCRTLFALS